MAINIRRSACAVIAVGALVGMSVLSGLALAGAPPSTNKHIAEAVEHAKEAVAHAKREGGNQSYIVFV